MFDPINTPARPPPFPQFSSSIRAPRLPVLLVGAPHLRRRKAPFPVVAVDLEPSPFFLSPSLTQAHPLIPFVFCFPQQVDGAKLHGSPPPQKTLRRGFSSCPRCARRRNCTVTLVIAPCMPRYINPLPSPFRTSFRRTAAASSPFSGELQSFLLMIKKMRALICHETLLGLVASTTEPGMRDPSSIPACAWAHFNFSAPLTGGPQGSASHACLSPVKRVRQRPVSRAGPLVSDSASRLSGRKRRRENPCTSRTGPCHYF